MSRFIHLHTHSHYSLLNALPKVEDLVAETKKQGMKSLALTDNGNLYGAIEFYKEAKKKDIHPIIGVDFFVALRKRSDKETIDKARSRLVLLAKNEKGYRNLVELITAAQLEGFYYKPRIDAELLEKHSEGIVAISPSFSGDIANFVKLHNFAAAKEKLAFYKKLFSSDPTDPKKLGDDFYLEITHHPEIPGHEEHMQALIAFARETNTQIVAAHDVYYLSPDDKRARETLISIANTNFDEPVPETDEDFSFITADEAELRFADTPDALDNCQAIAEKCTFEFELGKWVFPAYTIESGLSADDELARLSREGIAIREIGTTPEMLKQVEERMEYELSVIRNKGYSPYFLVVSDLLKYAREHGILSNIRGSVSGSLVTYLAGITNINPLEYEIPFERFLNPDRPSAPDIDMDFADTRREEMVEYAKRKYGADKVAQIGTFGTMAARGSVRDVTRALGYPYGLGDRVSKLIPMGAQGFPMTIDRALEEVEELKELYKSDEDVKKIIDMAKKIEGCARHMGVHAAGVVISPTAITDYTPLQFDPKSAGSGEGKIITQYDMYSIEEAGLLKFDFLGLRNLSIIADTLTLIKKLRGLEFTTEDIPIDDRKTFDMLARGFTEDLFQLNGDGMTRFLVELKPTTIHDINAMVALYRPGPIQFIPQYIERKHNPRKITYLDPALQPILQKTYGILVYQDDLLMMANKLAGYTWGEVDKFRKAVGKKIPAEMAEQKEKFINGCVKYQGWPLKKAQELWTWIEPFAAYGFNKAHSVSYGLVAYQTAYLKANFPAEYMASVLTHHSGDVEKVAISVAECKRLGIDVLPPDVNESFEGFTVVKESVDVGADIAGVTDESIDAVNRKAREGENDKIRFGLTTIKNFGGGIAEAIMIERKAGGHFITLEDFLSRIKDKNLNKKSVESLIKAGALDSLIPKKETPIPEWRSILLHNLDLLLTYNKDHRANGDNAHNSLFGGFEDSTLSQIRLETPQSFINQADTLLWEKELLGLYISGHPLESFRDRLAKSDTTIADLKNRRDKSQVIMGGIIEEIKEISTKAGDVMAFVKLGDLSGSVETVIFPKVYEEFRELLIPENCIVVKGKVSSKDGAKNILVEKIKAL